MNTLLIFFSFPIAVIIVSYILQKLLRNPVYVASLIFAIFIVVTFAAFDEMFLIATLAYTVLSFITALIVQAMCNNSHQHNNSSNGIINDNAINVDETNEDVVEAVEQIINNSNNNNSNTCGCGNRRRRRF